MVCIDTKIIDFRRWRVGESGELEVRLVKKIFGCYGGNLVIVLWMWGNGVKKKV